MSEARRQLLKGAVASRSDHLALVAAYNAWCRAVDKGGWGEWRDGGGSGRGVRVGGKARMGTKGRVRALGRVGGQSCSAKGAVGGFY